MPAIRIVFIVTSLVILLGIYLTGFSVVHWLLYLPVAGLGFAGITGICPGYILMKKLGASGKAEGLKDL